MDKEDLKTIGSQTAKGGFENENGIVAKFNSWKTDNESQKWLIAMGYKLKEIENVKAVKLTNRYKTDVQGGLVIKTLFVLILFFLFSCCSADKIESKAPPEYKNVFKAFPSLFNAKFLSIFRGVTQTQGV